MCTRVGLVALLAVLTAGCSAWFATTEPLPGVLAGGPEQLRVTLGDETQLTLRDAALEEDAVVGRVRDCGWAEESAARTCREGLATVSVSDIERVDVRRFSWANTLAVATLGIGIVGLMLSQITFTIFP